MRHSKLLILGSLFAALMSILGARGAFAEDIFADPSWAPIYERSNAALQKALDKRLKENPVWSKLAKQKKLAIGIIDLNGTPRFAAINGNRMMYAASLPKIAILLAAYVAIEEGTLEKTAEVEQDMNDMIRVSSNQAATRMIDRVGMERIGKILSDPQYELYDDERGGGLWVGKRYAKSGKRLGDPMHGISHGATATQVCRFYYLLESGRVISPEVSQEILGYLVDPGLNHKFVGVIQERAPKARLYRKSGTWRNYHSDSVLVHGPNWRNYILTAMVESSDGAQILKDLVPVVESLLRPVEAGSAKGAAGL